MGSLGKCTGRTIRHIVRLHQMLRSWRARACGGGSDKSVTPIPSDVPAGHVAVTIVGPTSNRRFVVRAAHLNHPLFRNLLLKAEEEYGYDHSGPLAIPCDEEVFEDLLSRLSPADSRSDDRSCHAAWQYQQKQDTRPLLKGLAACESSSPVW